MKVEYYVKFNYGSWRGYVGKIVAKVINPDDPFWPTMYRISITETTTVDAHYTDFEYITKKRYFKEKLIHGTL